jgi:hypothetical protein
VKSHLSWAHSTQLVPISEHPNEREREIRDRKWGEVVRDATFGGEETISPVLKVPRQCPLVLLVMHMIKINFYMTLEGLHYNKV